MLVVNTVAIRLFAYRECGIRIFTYGYMVILLQVLDKFTYGTGETWKFNFWVQRALLPVLNIY